MNSKRYLGSYQSLIEVQIYVDKFQRHTALTHTTEISR